MVEKEPKEIDMVERDSEGYDWYGYNINGWNREGINRETQTKYDKNGYNRRGYDKDGYDKNGWNSKGINRATQTKYDKDGYDKKGYDKDGYDKNGWNSKGTNRATQTKYDKDGYNKRGYDKNGYNREGYNQKGYDRDGYYKDLWNKEGINKKTGEKYDENGYNRYGLNSEGIDESGKKDEDIQLAEDWMAYGNNIKRFAENIGMTEEQVGKGIIEAIRKQPQLFDKIEQMNKKTKEKERSINKEYATKILSGELSVKDLAEMRNSGCNYELMHAMIPQEEKNQLDMKVIEYIVSEEEDIIKYLNIFANSNYSDEGINIVVEGIKNLKELCLKNTELKQNFKKIKELEKSVTGYKKKFNKNEVQKLGYYDEEKKETVMVEVTDELIELAKMHIRSNQGYLCHRTIHQAILKIIKGEITKEQIQEEYKNKNKGKIAGNDAEIKQALTQRILEQQKTIEGQRAQIEELKGCREGVKNE